MYSNHPTTEIMCLAYKIGDEPAHLWHPAFYSTPSKGTLEPLFDHVKKGGIVEAHNAFFERVIWANVGVKKYGFPELPFANLRCSMAKANMYGLPSSLDEACQVMQLANQKDKLGRAMMLKLCKPNSKGVFHESYADLQILFNYCLKDVIAEHELSGVLPDMPRSELMLWLEEQRMNWEGIKIDTELVNSAIIVRDAEKKLLNEEFYKITGLERATYRDRFRNWLISQGVDMPKMNKTQMRIVRARPLPEHVRRALDLYVQNGKISVSKFDRLAAMVGQDGYIRDTLKYHGAATGRFSGKGAQPQNLPRGNAKNAYNEKGDKMVFNQEQAVNDIKRLARDITMLPHFRVMQNDVMELLSSVLRGVIIPPEGMKLIGADYSAIEARTLFWFCDDQDGLDVFRRNECIYCDMASDIYRQPINKYDHPNQRQLGKQAILGLGYQTGVVTFFLTNIRGAGIYLTDQECYDMVGQEYNEIYDLVVDRVGGDKKAVARLAEAEEDFKDIIPELVACRFMVQRYRNKYASVVSMWEKQQIAAIQCVKEKKPVVCGKVCWDMWGHFLVCLLPSGRKMYFPHAQVIAERSPWGSFADKLYYVRVDSRTHQVGTGSTYGGRIVQNINQAIARDVLAAAMLEVKDGYKMILSIHDEIVAVTKDYDVKKFEQIMVPNVDWLKGCPITAEGKLLTRYEK